MTRKRTTKAVEAVEAVETTEAVEAVETTEAVEAVEAVEGPKISRAQMIRNMFYDDQMSRADIAKQLGVRYQVVYQATKDLCNMHHNPSTTGRNTMIEDDPDAAGNRAMIPRREYFRREYCAGRTRTELAKQLQVPFQTVYQATKDCVVTGLRDKPQADE